MYLGVPVGALCLVDPLELEIKIPPLVCLESIPVTPWHGSQAISSKYWVLKQYLS